MRDCVVCATLRKSNVAVSEFFVQSMLRALQSSEIAQPDLTRNKADDTERTRMLRSVMKSVARFASSGLGKRKDESAHAAGQLILKSVEDEEAKDEVYAKERNPCDWGLLSPRQERRLMEITRSDDFYVDMTGEEDCREMLKENSRKVLAHCQSLSISQPLPQTRAIETTPADGICLVSRIDAEDPESGGNTNYKMIDRAAWAWVQDNVNFKELDKLNTLIDENEYDGLRRGFLAQTKYHAVLPRLTDHSLKDKGFWKAAIQEAMFPTEAPDAPRGTLNPKGFSQRTVSKTTKGVKGARRNSNMLMWGDSSTVPGMSGRGKLPAGGRLQKDRSAPHFT